MPADAANMATDDTLERRLADVARLRCQGYSLRSIAETLSIGLGTVHRALEVNRDEWRQIRLEETADELNAKLEEYQHLRRIAYEDYERSKQDRQRRTARIKKAKPDAKPEENTNPPAEETTELVTEGQVGDPRFLTVVKGCLDSEAKLLGLMQPELHLHKHDDSEGPVQVIRFEVMPGRTDEEPELIETENDQCNATR